MGGSTNTQDRMHEIAEKRIRSTYKYNTAIKIELGLRMAQ